MENTTTPESNSATVEAATSQLVSILRGVSSNDDQIIQTLLEMRLNNIEASGLDPKTHALVSLAVLIPLDAPPASFMWQVNLARELGVTPEEMLGVLIAAAPLVGTARVVATAPEIALAIGVDLGLEEKSNETHPSAAEANG